MSVLDVNGIGLAYRLAGAGPPVVLVHGSWTDLHAWDAVAGGLAEGFTVVRYDRRGHGESARVGGTLHDDVEDLAGLLEGLGLAPAHVVGSSFGGVVVLALAAARPELLLSFVCHEPPALDLVPAGHPERGRVDAVVAVVGDVLARIEAGDREGAARRFVEDVTFGPGAWERLPGAVRERLVAHAETFAEERRDPGAHGLDLESLARFDRPALLTQGARSPAWFSPILERLAEVLPHAERHAFGSGHAPEATAVGEYVRTVSGFLRSTGG